MMLLPVTLKDAVNRSAYVRRCREPSFVAFRIFIA